MGDNRDLGGRDTPFVVGNDIDLGCGNAACVDRYASDF